MKHVRHTIAKLLATAGVACLAAQPAYAASSWLSTVTTIENGARTTYSAGELSSRPLPRATSTTAVFDLVPLGDVSREASKGDPRYFFRPFKTILVRTVAEGGESHYVRGPHRATLPALHRLTREEPS